jgi:hypothetical protein
MAEGAAIRDKGFDEAKKAVSRCALRAARDSRGTLAEACARASFAQFGRRLRVTRPLPWHLAPRHAILGARAW